MKIQGAVIKEQGVTFAILIVKSHVLTSHSDREKMQVSGQTFFPGVPIVLMAQDGRGIPKYWGRKDIVNFLASVHPSQIPWKKYTFN
jgi:hypothetical protein